ncbi:MAG TPA: histidine phosphatase family protein [Burkholderiales bacterium]|nr:histidine phosphatase family protein [Burkholderiales bacterium]
MQFGNLVPAIVAGVLSAQLAFYSGAARATGSDPLAELKRSGRVLVLPHAHAPGTGDPAHFKPHVCRTQRNLDAAGRKQAAQLGEHLRAAGVTHAKIYSSQWCRCLDTAKLLKLGPVSELPALNASPDRPEDRARDIDALRNFLAALPRDGGPVIMVTHPDTVRALSGGNAASAGGVILALDGSRVPRVVAEIKFK